MATRSDPHNPGRLFGRSEVERREVYMKKLENLLLEFHPVPILLLCLVYYYVPLSPMEIMVQLLRRNSEHKA